MFLKERSAREKYNLKIQKNEETSSNYFDDIDDEKE